MAQTKSKLQNHRKTDHTLKNISQVYEYYTIFEEELESVEDSTEKEVTRRNVKQNFKVK